MSFWIEAQWIRDSYCTGPPSALYLFQTQKPNNPGYYDSQDFSAIPTIYNTLNRKRPYPYSYCGQANVALPSGSFCCVSSLDLVESGNIASGSDILVSDLSELTDIDSAISKYAPASVSDNNYCIVTPVSSSQSSGFTSSAFGYTSSLFLANGECVVSNFNMSASCDRTGLLTLYSDPVCANLEATYQLKSTTSQTRSSSTFAKGKKQLTYLETIRRMFKLDKYFHFRLYNGLQVLIILVYFLIYYLASNTTVFKNDRNIYACNGVEFFLISLHCVLNYYLTETVKNILRNIVGGAAVSIQKAVEVVQNIARESKARRRSISAADKFEVPGALQAHAHVAKNSNPPNPVVISPIIIRESLARPNSEYVSGSNMFEYSADFQVHAAQNSVADAPVVDKLQFDFSKLKDYHERVDESKDQIGLGLPSIGLGNSQNN